jgi:FixJ family two-component response regulator
MQPKQRNDAVAPGATVFVVDDDPAVLRALSRLLRSHHLQVQTFQSAKSFLEQHDDSVPGCLILDIAMPDVSGLELQKILKSTNSHRPIVFLTGHSDVPNAIRAMRDGAINFLIKPVNSRTLLDAVNEALEKDRLDRSIRAEVMSVQNRLATLTPREREVMGYVVTGLLNKQIAVELGTVEKTIKVHRSRVMHKMGVRSLAELVRVAGRLGIGG